MHPLLNHKLVLCQGDILGLQTDAIVHSTNERLSDVQHAHAARPGSFAHRLCAYAGPGFRSECQGLIAVEGCVATGDAALMPSYALGREHHAARFVVHTVSPKYSPKFHIAAENALHGCIRRSLEVALDAGLGSIAFPLIHASSKQFPIEHAAHVCCRTLRRFLERYGRETIHTVVLCFQRSAPETTAAAAAGANAAAAASAAASAASSSSPAAVPAAVSVTSNEDEIFSVYSRILPLYFPRSAAEESLQLRFLPADIGDEVGATVVKERAIRIAEGFIARGPRPYSEEERNEMQSQARANAAASSSSSAATSSIAAAAIVAPPHRSSFDPVCALPSSLLPSRAEYVAAEEVPPEPPAAADSRRGTTGGSSSSSGHGYPGNSAAPAQAPAPIVYRDASTFSLAQEHPDTKRRREFLTSTTPAERALELAENDRFYKYLKNAQIVQHIDCDILDGCSYLYESQRADQLGRRILYVVPSRIPLNRRDGSANISADHLCAHAIRTLEPLMAHPFVMILFAPPPSTAGLHCPPSSWFRHFSSLLTRAHKANLKHLLILGADWKLRSHILWFCTFTGSAADKALWGKIVYLANLDELYTIIKPKEHLEIPPEYLPGGSGGAATKSKRAGEEDNL